ncbi:MAG TPA: hypothetical protein VGO52_21090 [Hyphomonadaceae bacterium]|nr:hypothetical protein [Hyphomonadaceae bacterium]
MLRFALVSCAAIGCLAGAMFLTAAHAEPQLKKPSAVTGDWTGKYICGQGVTRLDLHIEQGKGMNLTATFRFGPLPENPDVPKGAYKMTGTYDPMLRQVQLEGVKWIEYPQNYIMVGLDGRMDADGGRIKGIVPTMQSCTEFEVKRPSELIS